jgi:hypothetical protein
MKFSRMFAVTLLLVFVIGFLDILLVHAYLLPPTNTKYCSPDYPAYARTPPPTVAPTGLVQQLPSVCTSGFTAFNGRCFISSYKIHELSSGYPSTALWTAADTYCQSFGNAHLASVFTSTEACFIHEQLPGSGSIVGCTNMGNKGCHIGYNRNLNDGLNFYMTDDLFGGDAPDTTGQTRVMRFDRVPFLNGGFTPWGGGFCDFGYAPTYDYTSASRSNCQPNGVASGNGGQSCIRTMADGSWNDGSCDSVLPYVCTKIANCPPGYWRSALYVGMPQRYDLTMTLDGIDPTQFSAGMCMQCSPGKYHPQTRTAQQQSRECINCPAGTIGDAGASSPQCSGPCPAGFYCPLGSGRGPLAVTQAVPCSAGTYNPNTGGTDVTSCLETPSGYWSPLNSSTTFPCLAGTCGNVRSTVATCSELCPAGHYCPAGTGCANLTIPAQQEPKPCGSNVLYAPRGSTSCQTVSPGFYTDGGTETTRTTQVACPPGYYCRVSLYFKNYYLFYRSKN